MSDQVDIRVTADTNVLGEPALDRLQAVAEEAGLAVEIKTVTVNRRERGEPSDGALCETGVWDESRWDEAVWGGEPLAEVFVLDESRLDEGVLAGAGDAERLEEILSILTSGSFPPPGERTDLSEGQLRQLRDAMSFHAHVREHRDIFFTNDVRGFVNHGKRQAFEERFGTRIVTPDDLGVAWP